MAIRFAKVDADLDMHPKVRRAGRNGREVFLFVLRRNAALDRSGRVPLSYVEPWYLADQLQMSEVEAEDGMSRCVTAGLLRREGDQVSILGWDDDWSKAPLDEAERKRRQRERDNDKQSAPVNPPTSKKKSRAVTNSHAASVTHRDRPDSHASEEIRREERRGEKSREVSAPPSAREPSGPHQQAIAEFDAYYQRTHGGARPTWKGKNATLMAGLVKSHGAHEILRRIHVLETSPPTWPVSPWDMPTFSQHFDKIAVASQGRPESALDVALRIAGGQP